MEGQSGTSGAPSAPADDPLPAYNPDANAASAPQQPPSYQQHSTIQQQTYIPSQQPQPQVQVQAQHVQAIQAAPMMQAIPTGQFQTVQLPNGQQQVVMVMPVQQGQQPMQQMQAMQAMQPMQQMQPMQPMQVVHQQMVPQAQYVQQVQGLPPGVSAVQYSAPQGQGQRQGPRQGTVPVVHKRPIQNDCCGTRSTIENSYASDDPTPIFMFLALGWCCCYIIIYVGLCCCGFEPRRFGPNQRCAWNLLIASAILPLMIVIIVVIALVSAGAT